MKDNVMRNSTYIYQVTLNIGSGTSQEKLNKAVLLLEKISGKKPVKCLSKHRILAWGIRVGLPIGCKVNVRGEDAKVLLKKLLTGVENKVEHSSFDNYGNFGFGIKDYIEIDGVKYDPNIGMMGLEVAVSLRRKGYRVQKRSRNKSKIGKEHHVNLNDAVKFLKDNYNTFIIGLDEE